VVVTSYPELNGGLERVWGRDSRYLPLLQPQTENSGVTVPTQLLNHTLPILQGDGKWFIHTSKILKVCTMLGKYNAFLPIHPMVAVQGLKMWKLSIYSDIQENGEGER
jgi:hypothetical protein